MIINEKADATIKVGDHVSVRSLSPSDKSNIKNNDKSYREDAYYLVKKIDGNYLICTVDPKVVDWDYSKKEHRIHKSNVSFIVRGNNFIVNESYSIDESVRSDELKNYLKTSVKMLAELKLKLRNASSMKDIDPKSTLKAALQIDDLMKTINNIPVNESCGDAIAHYSGLDSEEDELNEDVVKLSNGKWANKGKDGKTHGEFDTREDALAQMRAMYSNGFGG